MGVGVSIIACSSVYRFEGLELKCLSGPIDSKYSQTLVKFSAAIDQIKMVI